MKLDLTPTPWPITPPADVSVDLQAVKARSLAETPMVQLIIFQKGTPCFSMRLPLDKATALADGIHATAKEARS